MMDIAWLPLFIGFALAVVLAVLGRLTGFDRDRSFYPTVLIVIASYYILFAFMTGEAIVPESIAAALFSVVALAGGLRWPVLAGIGIVLHGLFDFIHPTLITNPGVPHWWPAFCAGVDIPLGLWVIWLAQRRAAIES